MKITPYKSLADKSNIICNFDIVFEAITFLEYRNFNCPGVKHEATLVQDVYHFPKNPLIARGRVCAEFQMRY